MGRQTTPQAKSNIRSSLREIADPQPSESAVKELWAHFESLCVYCEKPLNVDKREGQLDHLVSKSKGGLNHIYNRALSCGPCNGDEKRDMDWKDFLLKKSPETADVKIKKIEEWIDKKTPSSDKLKELEELIMKADELSESVCKSLDEVIEKLRNFKGQRSLE